MSSVSQNNMTDEGLEKMFAEWDAVAPEKPTKGGWHGSLQSCADAHNGYFYFRPIEDYDDDECIITIGAATVQNGVYTEYYD